MSKIIGIALICAGIYFLGQNIIFTTRISPYWWQDISAAGAVIAISLGILMVLFGASDIKAIGWFIFGAGIVMVFASGGVVLKPTSMIDFALGVAAFAGGIRLYTGESLS